MEKYKTEQNKKYTNKGHFLLQLYVTYLQLH